MHYEHLEHDLGTAAFLVVRGFKLIGLQRKGGQRYAFCFDDPDCRASSVAALYFQGDPVPARSLVNAERDLKTRLYAEKDSNGHGNTRRGRHARQDDSR